LALSLQQKLEKVSAGHAGFSRAVGDATPREISDPAALQHLFPEFYSPRGAYDSILTVPLIGGQGRLQDRKPLGLLLFCSRIKGILSPADGKLIGSAVAFLAAAISEMRVSRLMRNERRLSQNLRAAEAEFSAWMRSWAAEENPQRRLQTAITGLAEHTGDFVGCGRYLPHENRWEPLALAAVQTDEMLLGNDGFREAAIKTVRAGKETVYQLPAVEGRPGKPSLYRMVPVADPANPDTHCAVLFIPVMATPPLWWENAIATLTELAKVVLVLQSTVDAAASEKKPETDEIFDIGQLMGEMPRCKPEELPRVLARVLPDGWRAALWQSCSGSQSAYRLRLASGGGTKTVYNSLEDLVSAPEADQLEVNAHLGGLVRVDYKGPGVLTQLWSDFGDGWRALRYPAPFATRNWGWLSIYHQVAAGDVDDRGLRFFKTLAGLLELIITYWDMSSPDYIKAQAMELADYTENRQTGAISGEQPEQQTPKVHLSHPTIGRAITDWIAMQPEAILPGRIDFNTSPDHATIVEPKIINEVLDWGAANLANGMPEAAYLTVNGLVDNGRITIVFDRTLSPDEEPDRQVWQPAAAVPVKQSVREILDLWDAKSRIINSTRGPRKLILSFTPREQYGESAGSRVAGNILVVDEEELIRDLLLGMLDVLGHPATAASSTEEGLKYFHAGNFNKIILGQSMPAGNNLAREVKDFHPNTRIILVREPGNSGRAAESVIGIDAVLTKPFRIDDLKTALQKKPVVSDDY
jgi:CheY-like chemotaxis protein